MLKLKDTINAVGGEPQNTGGGSGGAFPVPLTAPNASTTLPVCGIDPLAHVYSVGSLPDMFSPLNNDVKLDRNR